QGAGAVEREVVDLRLDATIRRRSRRLIDPRLAILAPPRHRGAGLGIRDRVREADRHRYRELLVVRTELGVRAIAVARRRQHDRETRRAVYGAGRDDDLEVAEPQAATVLVDERADHLTARTRRVGEVARDRADVRRRGLLESGIRRGGLARPGGRIVLRNVAIAVRVRSR